MVEEYPPGLGELDTSPVTGEELNADGALELLDLLGETRLSDVEPFRRSAEMELLGDGDEIPELTELYGCGHEVNTLSSAPTVRLPFEDLLHVLSGVR
jgi:hypothetical protein